MCLCAICNPIPRQKFIDTIDGMIGDASHDVTKPCLGVDAVELGGLCRPPNYAESGPVWRVVVTLVSSIACTAAPFHSA